MREGPISAQRLEAVHRAENNKIKNKEKKSRYGQGGGFTFASNFYKIFNRKLTAEEDRYAKEKGTAKLHERVLKEIEAKCHAEEEAGRAANGTGGASAAPEEEAPNANQNDTGTTGVPSGNNPEEADLEETTEDSDKEPDSEESDSEESKGVQDSEESEESNSSETSVEITPRRHNRPKKGLKNKAKDVRPAQPAKRKKAQTTTPTKKRAKASQSRKQAKIAAQKKPTKVAHGKSPYIM